VTSQWQNWRYNWRKAKAKPVAYLERVKGGRYPGIWGADGSRKSPSGVQGQTPVLVVWGTSLKLFC